MLAATRPMVRRPDRSDAFVVAAAVAGAAFIVWLGLGLTFFSDEWAVISDRTVSLPDLLRPFNEHWLAGTIVVYRAMLGLFGMTSYVPYHIVLAATHALVAILVYALVRRRTLRPVAVGIAIIVLLFGSGFENLFWSIQIGFVGATALGLGALLLVDDVPTLPGRGRVAAATAMLTVAIMTSGYGLFVLGLVGFDLLVAPRRRRWVLALLVPAGIYGAWYLVYGRTGLATHGEPFTVERVSGVPAFIFEGISTAFGSAVGGGPIVGLVALVGSLAWLVVLAVRRLPIPRRAVACILAIVGQYAIIGLVRDQLGVDAALYTRYSYFSGIVALICLASLIGKPVIARRRVSAWATAGIAVLVLSLTWNVTLLIAGKALFADRAEATRGVVALATTGPLAEAPDPAVDQMLVPAGHQITSVIARYGSPLSDALAPASVPPVSARSVQNAAAWADYPLDPISLAGLRR